MSWEIKHLSDLNSREWELLAHNAESWSQALDATGEHEAAAHYRERARSFNTWAAREEAAQTRFETTGEVTPSREDVSLDDVEQAIREAIEDAEQRNDGVNRFALVRALDFLGVVFADESPTEGVS